MSVMYVSLKTNNWCEGGEWSQDDYIHTTNECIITESDYFSGLLDSEGSPLYRVKQKIGFI